MPANYSFLGGSQTFIGTLATIVFLFVIANSSNFIFVLLGEIRESINAKMNKLKEYLGLKNIEKSKKYSQLMDYIMNEKNDDALRLEGQKLVNKIHDVQNELLLTYYPFDKEVKPYLERIQNAKEQLLAPLYVFGFCIVVFLFDEMLRCSRIVYNDFLFSVLTVFVFLSYIYWLFLWYRYFYRMKGMLNQLSSDNNAGKGLILDWKRLLRKTLLRYVKWMSRLNPIGAASIRIMWHVLFLILSLAASLFLENPWCFIIFGLAMPLVLSGVIRISGKRGGGYSYLYMCGHFAAISIEAVVMTFVIWIFVGITDSQSILMMKYYDNFYIKSAVTAFIILNGIILPFLMPYLIFRKFKTRVAEEVSEGMADAREKLTSLNNEITLFLRKI